MRDGVWEDPARGCSGATGDDGSVGTDGGIEGWGCKVDGVCCCCGGNSGTLKMPPEGFAGEGAGTVDGVEKMFVEKTEGFSWVGAGWVGGGADGRPVDGVKELACGGTNVAAKGLSAVVGPLGALDSSGAAFFAGAVDISPEVTGPAGQVGCDVSGAGAGRDTEVDTGGTGNGEEVLAPVPNAVEEPAPNADLKALPPPNTGVEAGVVGPNVAPPKALGFVTRPLNADAGGGALVEDENVDPEGLKADSEPNELGAGLEASPANAEVPEGAGIGIDENPFWGGGAASACGCPPKLLASHSVAFLLIGWLRGIACLSCAWGSSSSISVISSAGLSM